MSNSESKELNPILKHNGFITKFKCPYKLVRATDGSSGYDLLYYPSELAEEIESLDSSSEDYSKELENQIESFELIILPGHRALVKTGVSLNLLKGYESQVRAKSGLAYKFGISVVNGPGTIDSDYPMTQEIGVILYNSGDKPFVINIGDKIAQLVFAKVEFDEMLESLEYKGTEVKERTGGYGSTGK